MVIFSKYDIEAESLLDHTPDSTIIINNDGIIVYVNQKTLQMFGYTRVELISKSIETLIPSRFHYAHSGHLAGFFANSRSREMGEGQKLFARKKNGSEFAAEISLSPIDTKSGILVICSIRNVTERIKIQDALAHSNAELEQFAYVASHDLQEPLRAVTSFSQLLGKRYQGQLDKNADEFIEFIVDGATRMQNLINDLLAYSRLDSKQRTVENVDFNDILQEVIKNLRISIQDSQAEIIYQKLPTLRANATHMAQLFQNLISNAIKFQSDSRPVVTITTEKRHHIYTFSVSDNGIGIETQYFDRIFTLFQRLNTDPGYSGTGIGLTLCKKIVALHNGKIWLESTPGSGTTFFFTLTN